EALALQRALHSRTDDDYLLLLEHPHTYTLGKRADPAHVLVDPNSVGAELITTDRGGDVTYHGPGQLVGYPIGELAVSPAGTRDVVAHVRRIEAVLISVLDGFGIQGERVEGRSGVWVGNEKIAAIGVRVARGRTMHGFALNVDCDLAMFDHIVPCGISDAGVASMAALLGTAPAMTEVIDAVIVAWARAADATTIDRASVGFVRPAEPIPVEPGRRPGWMKVTADLGPEYRRLKRLVHEQELHTVCEEAGCPNIFECWSQRTATFMILGDRCTRACGFCLVDTRKPFPIDPDEPRRVADAVATLGLAHAVITSVARDDVSDGGAAGFVATIQAVRDRNPETTIEVLIPDCKGDADALAAIFDARPDVLNHNLETIARLQRRARPSAGYARSLTVLARSKAAGLVTKSGIILGLGEELDEVRSAIVDLRNVGVDILTLGQYLQPSPAHLPVARWVTPEEFDELGEFARTLGFVHVESGPLVRSSYHARDGASSALTVTAS
ncbi:MAG: lipoyl synthase, partial [Acidimicrobiia bacterium]|nr:lipoyl synthase [Acidimicrobiia bacterium]